MNRDINSRPGLGEYENPRKANTSFNMGQACTRSRQHYELGQKETAATSTPAVTEDGARSRSSNRIPRPIRFSRKSASFHGGWQFHRHDDDVTLLAAGQRGDDVTLSVSLTAEGREVFGMQEEVKCTSAETLPGSGGRSRMRRTSSIPTLKGVSRKASLSAASRTKHGPTTTTATPSPSETAPPHRSEARRENEGGLGGSEAARRGGDKNKHKQSSRQLAWSAVDVSPCLRPLEHKDGRISAEGATGELCTQSLLQRTAPLHYRGEAISHYGNHQEGKHLSKGELIRKNRVTLYDSRTCRIAHDHNASDAPRGNERTRQFEQRGHNIGTTSQPHTCPDHVHGASPAADPLRHQISHKHGSGLTQTETGLTPQSVPDSIPEFDTHSDREPTCKDPGPEGRKLGKQRCRGRGSPGDEGDVRAVSVRGSIGSAAEVCAVTCQVSALPNRAHASLEAGTGLEERGGVKASLILADSFQPASSPRRDEFTHEDSGLVLDTFRSECEIQGVHSSARVACPLDTAASSLLRQASLDGVQELREKGKGGVSVSESVRISARLSPTHDWSGGNDARKEKGVPEIAPTAVQGHGADGVRHDTLSTRPTDYPRNAPDQNIVSENLPSTLPVNAVSCSVVTATPAGDSNQKPSRKKHSSAGKGGSRDNTGRKPTKKLSQNSSSNRPGIEASDAKQGTQLIPSGSVHGSQRESNLNRPKEVHKGGQVSKPSRKGGPKASRPKDSNQQPTLPEKEQESSAGSESDINNGVEFSARQSAGPKSVSTLENLTHSSLSECILTDVSAPSYDKPGVSGHNYDTNDVPPELIQTKASSGVTPDRCLAALAGWQHTTSTDPGGHAVQVEDYCINSSAVSRPTGDTAPACIEPNSIEKESNYFVTESSSKDCNPELTDSSSSGKDSNLESIRQLVSGKTAGHSAKTLIPRRKKSNSDVSCGINLSVSAHIRSKPHRTKSHSSVSREVVAGSADVGDTCDKELVFDTPGRGFTVEDLGGPVQDKSVSENDSDIIYLTRITDVSFPNDGKDDSSGDNNVLCSYATVESAACSYAGDGDTKLPSESTRDSNRDSVDTCTGLRTGRLTKHHDSTATPSSTTASTVFREHSEEDVDSGASVKVMALTSGDLATTRKSQLMSPPSRKKEGVASKENDCGRPPDRNHVDKHGGKASGVTSGERISAGTTKSIGVKTASGKESVTSSIGRHGGTRGAGYDVSETARRSSASATKAYGESTSRKPLAQKESSRPTTKTSRSKKDADVAQARDVSPRTVTVVVREAVKGDRRSSSPKLKQSKENENRKQKSASPQSTPRLTRQGDSGKSPSEPAKEKSISPQRSRKTLSSSPKDSVSKADEEAKSKAKALAEESKDLSSPEKEKVDSPTKETVDVSADQKSKKETKPATSESTRSGVRSGSVLKKQASRLPRRSTEALSENKPQIQRATSSSAVRSSSSKTKMTSSAKNASSGTTTSSARSTSSTGLLSVRKTSSPDSDISSTSDVSRSSRSSLMSSTSSTRLKAKESQTKVSSRTTQQDTKTSARGRPSEKVTKPKSVTSSSKLLTARQESDLRLKKTFSPSFSECSLSTRDSSVDSRLEDDAQSIVSSVSVRSARSAVSSVSSTRTTRSATKETAKSRPTKQDTSREARIAGLTKTRTPKTTTDKTKPDLGTKAKADNKHKLAVATDSQVVCGVASEMTPADTSASRGKSSSEVTATREGKQLPSASAVKQARGLPQTSHNWKKVQAAVKKSDSNSGGTSQKKAATGKRVTTSTTGKQKPGPSRKEKVEKTQTNFKRTSLQPRSMKESQEEKLTASRPMGSDGVRSDVKGLHSAHHATEARETRDSKQSATFSASDPSHRRPTTEEEREKSLSTMEAAATTPHDESAPLLSDEVVGVTGPEENGSVERDETKPPTELDAELINTAHLDRLKPECGSVESDLINKSEPSLLTTGGGGGEEEGGTMEGAGKGVVAGEESVAGSEISAEDFTLSASDDVIRQRADCSGGVDSGYPLHPTDMELLSPYPQSLSAVPDCQHSTVAASDAAPRPSVMASDVLESDSPLPESGSWVDSISYQAGELNGHASHTFRHSSPVSQRVLSPAGTDDMMSGSSCLQNFHGASETVRVNGRQEEKTTRPTDEKKATQADPDKEHKEERKAGLENGEGQKQSHVEENHSVMLAKSVEIDVMLAQTTGRDGASPQSQAVREGGEGSVHPAPSQALNDKEISYEAEATESKSDKTFTAQPGITASDSPGRGLLTLKSPSLGQREEDLTQHPYPPGSDTVNDAIRLHQHHGAESTDGTTLSAEMETAMKDRTEGEQCGVNDSSGQDYKPGFGESRTSPDAEACALAEQRELEVTGTMAASADCTLGMDDVTPSHVAQVTRAAGKHIGERQVFRNCESNEQQPTSTAGKLLVSSHQINDESSPQLISVSTPSVSVPEQQPSPLMQQSLSSTAVTAALSSSSALLGPAGDDSVPKVSRRPAHSRTPASVRQRMTSSHPPLYSTPRPPALSRPRPKSTPCLVSYPPSARGTHRGSSQRIRTSPAVSSLSPALTSAAMSSRSKGRPVMTQLPFRLHAQAGRREAGAGGEEREGLASVLPADTALPSEEPWTHFPAGNAAATGTACLSEQQDAGEERAAVEGEGSLPDIADLSTALPHPHPRYTPSPPVLSTPAADRYATPTPAARLTPEFFSTPVGTLSPDIFSTPIGSDPEPEVSPDRDLCDSPVTYDDDSDEFGPEPSVLNRLDPHTRGESPGRESQDTGAEHANTCRTESASSSGTVEFQNARVISPPCSSLPAAQPRGESAKNISHHHQHLASFSSAPSSVQASPCAATAAQVGSSLPHLSTSSHLPQPLSPCDGQTDDGETVTRAESALPLQRHQTWPPPKSPELPRTAAAALVDRYDVTGLHPTFSPDSCLSPADSCSDAGVLSARFLMEVCDTQADLSPRVYRGQDSMSTSGSSGEMIFSSSSPHFRDSPQAGSRCLSGSSHSVSPELHGDTDRLQFSLSPEDASSQTCHRAEHVQLVNWNSVSSEILDTPSSSLLSGMSPASLSSSVSLPALTSASRVTSSSVTTETSHSRKVETYTSVVEVSIVKSSQRSHCDSSNTTTDLIYCSSRDSDVTLVVDSDRVGSVFVNHSQNPVTVGVPLTGEHVPEVDVGDTGDVVSMTAQKLSSEADSLSTEKLSKVEEISESTIRHTSVETISPEASETLSDVTTTTSAKTSTSSKSRVSRREETGTRTKVTAKKIGPVTVKPISTCVQDLQKMTQEEHPGKTTKKPPQPVTLTSVKDSVMKFETTGRSKVNAKNAKDSALENVSSKRSSSSSSSLRIPVTSTDSTAAGKIYSVGIKSSRSVSSSRRESSSTTKQVSSSSVHKVTTVTTAKSNQISISKNASGITKIVSTAVPIKAMPSNSSSNAETCDLELNAAESTDVSDREAEIFYSKPENKEETEFAMAGGDLTVPRLETGISETPREARDDRIGRSTPEGDKRNSAGAKHSLHTGHDEGVVMMKTSEQTVTAVSDQGCMSSNSEARISLQTDAMLSCVDLPQTRSDAVSQKCVSAERSLQRECTEMPGVLRTDKKDISSEAEGVDVTGTQTCLAVPRADNESIARETRGVVVQDTEPERDTMNKNRDQISVPSETARENNAQLTPSSHTSVSMATHSSGGVNEAGRGVTEPCRRGATTDSADYVTPGNQSEEDKEVDTSSPSPEPPRESRFENLTQVSKEEKCSLATEDKQREEREALEKSGGGLDTLPPAVGHNETQLGEGHLQGAESTAEGEKCLSAAQVTDTTQTQAAVQFPDRDAPAPTDPHSAKVGHDSSVVGKKGETTVNIKTRPKVQSASAPIHPDGKKPGSRASQVARAKTKTPSPPRTRTAPVDRSESLKREGSLKTKPTKENAASTMNKTSPTSSGKASSTTATKSASSSSSPATQSQTTKTTATRTSTLANLKRAEDSRPLRKKSAGDVQRPSDRKECTRARSGSFPREDKQSGTISHSPAHSEADKTNSDWNSTGLEAKEVSTSQSQGSDETEAERISLSGSDKLLCRSTQSDSIPLSKEALETSHDESVGTSIVHAKTMVSRIVTNVSDSLDQRGNVDLLKVVSHDELKVTSHDQKVKSIKPQSEHLPDAKDSEASTSAAQSSALGKPVPSEAAQQVCNTMPDLQPQERAGSTETEELKAPVSGSSATAFDIDEPSVEAKHVEQVSQKEKIQENAASVSSQLPSAKETDEKEKSESKETANFDQEITTSQDEHSEVRTILEDTSTSRRTQNENGQKVVAKWKKLVLTSRVTNLKETLTNKLSAPVARSDSVSPPPAPVSPTPPRKYKWAREGGIWKKVYLESSAGDSLDIEDQTASMPNVSEENSFNFQPASDSADREEEKTMKDENKDNSDIDETPIDFPSVLAMSKRFEQEKENQELKPRVSSKKMDRSAKQNNKGKKTSTEKSDESGPQYSTHAGADLSATARDSDITAGLSSENRESVCGATLSDKSAKSADNAGRDLHSEDVRLELDGHRLHSVLTPTDPPVHCHPDTGSGGYPEASLTTGSGAGKAGTHPYCLDDKNRELSDQATRYPSKATAEEAMITVDTQRRVSDVAMTTPLDLRQGEGKRQERDDTAHSESGTQKSDVTHSLLSHPDPAAAFVEVCGNQNKAATVDHKWQTTPAEKMDVNFSSDMPAFAGAPTHTSTFASSHVSSFAPRPSSAERRRKEQEGAERENSGSFHTTGARTPDREIAGLEPSREEAITFGDIDTDVQGSEDNSCHKPPQHHRQEPTTTSATIAADVVTDTHLSSKQRRIESGGTNKSGDQIVRQSPPQLRKAGASFSHADKQDDGNTHVEKSDSAPEKQHVEATSFPPFKRPGDADLRAAAVGHIGGHNAESRASRAEQVVDTEAEASPRPCHRHASPGDTELIGHSDEKAQSMEEGPFRDFAGPREEEFTSAQGSDDGTGTNQPAVQEVDPSSSSLTSSSRAASKTGSDLRIRDSPENVRANDSSTGGSRSPVPTRLSEGFKRFQKSRGTPWGQQYLQRGERVTSPRSNMAASNWHLLVSKVTASAGKEAISGQEGKSTSLVNENRKETGTLSAAQNKEAISEDRACEIGSESRTKSFSEAVCENKHEPSPVSDRNVVAVRESIDSSETTTVSQQADTASVAQNSLSSDSIPKTATSCEDRLQLSGSDRDNRQFLTDTSSDVAELDTSDMRKETTFSDTVFETVVPARTPERGTPKHSRSTPERSTGVQKKSVDNDAEDTDGQCEKTTETSSNSSTNSVDKLSSSSSSSTSLKSTSKLKRQDARSRIIEPEDESLSVDEKVTSQSVDTNVNGETTTETGVPSSSGSSSSSSLLTSPSRSCRGGTSAKLISVTVWDTHDGDKALRSGARRVFWDLDSKELLAGISEHEEQGCSQDEHPTPIPHVSRSLQATPEKQRDVSRDRDANTAAQPRRRRGSRRSLSLPTGSLSYGDVKISYRDGHFVTEPIDGAAEEGTKPDRPRYDRTRSDSGASVLCGSLMNIGSQEEMREEILSLLERGFSTEDITLLFSRYLDQNSNHLAESAVSGASQSTQSLTAPSLYSSQSLPRPRRQRDALNRPVSVDDVRLWQQLSQSDRSLASQDGGEEDLLAMKRTESFSQAMAVSVVPRKGGEDGAESTRLHRHNSDEGRTDRSRSHRPGFIQRMLQKRKSFHDKPSSNGRTSKEDSSSITRKDARDSATRKVSIKGIFRRKSSTNLEARKDSDEPGSPPIATFMNDDDIGAISSLPGSPTCIKSGRKASSGSQLGQQSVGVGVVCSDRDQVDASVPGAVLRRDLMPLPGGAGSRMSERYSGEYSYCEYDLSSECRSSADTLTPRSASPSNVSTLTLEGESNLVNRTLDMDSTLLASPGSLDRTRLSLDRTPMNAGHPTHPVRKPSLPKQDFDKLAAIVQGEITSSNSNDSGIQHDVTIGSNESLKIPPEIASQLTSAVKLRNSPSPKQERPKSDFTVRWADLLEQVKETNVTYRRDGSKLRKRPRPKSDLAEDSAEDEGLDYDSTSSEEGGSSIPVDTSLSRSLGGPVGALGLGAPLGGGSGVGLQQYDSLVSLVELRRPANRGRLDTAAIQAAKLAKSRRMSTPQPIKTRVEKIIPRSHKQVCLVRSHSMPDNLDRLHRKKNYFSLIGSDMQSVCSHNSGGDDSSDESEFSVDYHHEKSLSTRASRVTLATLDQMIEEENLTYAEALWDHVTMDPDELGFRAGDVIRVTDTADKHWWYGATEHRDGWFPAAFVRLRVNQDDLEAEMTLRIQEEEEEAQRQMLQQSSSSTSQSNKTQLRANVVNEIITAEAEYVKHLRDVIEGYLKQARKRPEMFPVEKVTVIFSNIEVIYDFATKLLADLQAAVNKDQPHLTEFGHCFLHKTHEFEIYSEYCNNHPAACEELRELYRVKRYRHFFEACRLLQEMTEIPLEGFLLTPVQKICKYHLQLAELLKYTPSDHPDHSNVQSAVEAMKRIAKLVNERKRKMESIETLAEWQMLVDDWEGPDILDDSSELIYSGELNKINANGWSQERYFFLFDHQLVYCKKDLLKKNSFGYKGRINMDHSEIVSIPDGRDVQYNVTVRNSFKIHDQERSKWYLMVAKTSQIKQRWLKAFSDERRRVFDDMENNFNIPFHLKQAIVTNLKQKSSSTKSKGKRKASRTASLRASKTSSWVSTNATLPRLTAKSALTSTQGSSSQQTNKLMNFLLGGKKK